MPLILLFLILPALTILSVHASGSQCSFTNMPTSLSPFPTTTYLSYNESTNFVLDDYFTGVNLSFSFNLTSLGYSQQVQKTLQYTNGGLLQSLPQLAGSQIVDIYWDDSNVTSVSQQWTTDSLLLFLSEADSVYTLIVGSFDNIQASNISDTPLYSSIIIQPPANSTADSELQCSKITLVGELQYYIDCVLTDPTTGTVDNYFYYVAFPTYPPSNYTISPILNNLTLPYSPIMSSRVITSAVNQVEAEPAINNTYLVRYYNGLLQLPSSANVTQTVEVFNVTEPSTPSLLITYNSSMFGMANISSIKVSGSFMYVVSAEGVVTIIYNWYYTENLGGQEVVQQYAYDEMIFTMADLRVTSVGGETKESFIAIGVLNSVNLTALSFVAQTFQEFYTIPLPPLQQTTLNINVFSVALGEDFVGISYSVAETFSNSACYYYAIADISLEESSDCHTLWAFKKDNFISYSRMNPAADTDILFIYGMDNLYSNYSIFRPAITLYEMEESTAATLFIQNGEYNSLIDFNIVVLQPNDMGIYLDLDSSDNLETYALQTNGNFIVFLNQSIYGPELNFGIQSENISSYNVYTGHQLASDYTIQEGNTFLAMHRRHVSALLPVLLLENSGNQTTLRLGNITGSSIFNITSLNLSEEKTENIKTIAYYYISGYDIFIHIEDRTTKLLYLDVNSYFQGNTSPGFTVDLGMFYHIDIIETVLAQRINGDIQAILITNSTLYVCAFAADNPQLIAYGISTQDYPFPAYPPFLPAKIITHPAFVDVAFITTTAGNVTYIIEFSDAIEQSDDDDSDFQAFMEFNIIFAQHPADSAEDVIVQPFANNLFYIFPSLNAIEHWDLSVIRSPFFRRNLDMYSYNLSVLTSSFVQKGTAFSTTTDTLYILAQGTKTDNTEGLYVLVLKPNPANSYLVQAIELPFSLSSPQTINIDVTETQNFVYGNLLGDILVALIGSNYYFWEIYSTPYLTFPVLLNDFELGMINIQYPANFTVQNEWNETQALLLIDIYQNEKQLSLLYPEINITSNETSSITLGINEYWSGTVYNFSISNGLENAVNITPFIHFTSVSNFSVSNHVDAVLEMSQYTYYLTSFEITLVSNADPTVTHQVQIIGPSGCSMYIDSTETYGVAICGTPSGLYPFSLTDFFDPICDYIPLPSFQDIFIDADNSLMFLLMQAADGGNSNITIYNINQTICNLTNPVFVMQGWSFSGSCPDFAEFDVLIMSSSTQVVYMIFVLDLNFGLRIINYASVINLVSCVYSYSFSDLYQYLGPSPNPIEFCDVKLLENECAEGSFGTCNANLLLVPHNFHVVLLQMQLENSGLEMASPSYVVFLVPSDYWVDDYEVSGDLLILLGRNLTQRVPSLDMLAYNMTSSSYLQNKLNESDSTLYQVPMWLNTLVDDAKDLPYPLVHPTVYLHDEAEAETFTLSFPNLQNQSTVTYNITSNITVNWNNSVIKNMPIDIIVANNFQEVVLPIIFEQEEAPAAIAEQPSSKWFYIGCGLVGLGVLILAILVIWCYRKTYKNRIQYSRKTQKDPLRELMLFN